MSSLGERFITEAVNEAIIDEVRKAVGENAYISPLKEWREIWTYDAFPKFGVAKVMIGDEEVGQVTFNVEGIEIKEPFPDKVKFMCIPDREAEITRTVEIYFKDLTEEAKERVLQAAQATADDNWELAPLAILEFSNVER